MTHPNVFSIRQGFEVLQTTERSQSAAMILDKGEMSSEQPNRHPKSDQVLLVMEGTVTGEIADQRVTLKTGESVIVPANTPHRFINTGQVRAVTFSVYAPPAYGPDEKE
jgi:mannose-6-phosphate isomerase-like protein (cupin superfamily)